jgi:hypothetical protein
LAEIAIAVAGGIDGGSAGRGQPERQKEAPTTRTILKEALIRDTLIRAYGKA